MYPYQGNDRPGVELLPGGGGRYISEVFGSAGIGLDEIDTQECSELAIQQLTTGSAGGSFQIEERLTALPGLGWSPLGAALAIGPAGAVNKFNMTVRPFSHIRLNLSGVTGLNATNTVQLILQGGRVAGGAVF